MKQSTIFKLTFLTVMFFLWIIVELLYCYDMKCKIFSGSFFCTFFGWTLFFCCFFLFGSMFSIFVRDSVVYVVVSFLSFFFFSTLPFWSACFFGLWPGNWIQSLRLHRFLTEKLDTLHTPPRVTKIQISKWFQNRWEKKTADLEMKN